MTQTEYERPGWSPVDPAWVPDIIRIPDPAAGAGVTIPVSSYAWVPRAIVFRLVSAVAAANRIVEVDYTGDDGFAFCRNGAGRLQAASETTDYCGKSQQGFSDWTSSGADLTPVYFPLEPLRIEPGSQVRIVIGNVQAADQLSRVALAVDRFKF